jgi:hypothetical protein
MHTLTYQFPGVASRPPIVSQQNDPVIMQLAPLYAGSSTTGSPFLLATVASVSFASGKWRYLVNLPQDSITGSPAGKFLPTLSAFSPVAQYLSRRIFQALNYEVWGPTEKVVNTTRWVGNPSVSGIITAIQLSCHTPGDSTVQLSLAGQHVFAAPVALDTQSQIIPLSIPIAAGQRINAIGTGEEYGQAKGLQVEIHIA